MTQEIRDRGGRCVGRVQVSGNTVIYMDSASRVVARFQNGNTYNAGGTYLGNGDQGMMALAIHNASK